MLVQKYIQLNYIYITNYMYNYRYINKILSIYTSKTLGSNQAHKEIGRCYTALTTTKILKKLKISNSS